jgi:tetratricopeptide (TPR) repeat protein
MKRLSLFGFAFLAFILIAGCRHKIVATFYMAEQSYIRYNFDQTIHKINDIQRYKDLNSEEYRLRAQSYERVRNYDAAISDFLQALRLRQGNKFLVFCIAKDYLVVNKPDSARMYYTQEGSNWIALDGTAECLVAENKPDSAIKFYETAIKVNPQGYVSYNNLGNLYDDAKKYDEAVKCFTLLISKGIINDIIYFNRGVAYMYLKMNASALSDYNSAIRLNPNHSLYYLNRGMAYYRLQKYSDACNDWSTAATMNNDEARKYLQLYCGK